MELKAVTIEASSTVTVVEKEKETETETLPTKLHFRDGEHSGEATLDEIIEGRDDGELSDYCQVFDPTTDSWQMIAFFDEKDNFNDIKEGPIESEDPIPEDANALESISRDIPSIEMEPNEDFQPVNKNDRKKPKRDISAWGKGQIHTLTTKVEGNENDEKDITVSRRKKSRHIKPPPKLMRLCTQAMIQWDMLEDGDRLMLGLSGGKDSMSLLHVLLEFQKKLPVRFEIEVSTRFFFSSLSLNRTLQLI